MTYGHFMARWFRSSAARAFQPTDHAFGGSSHKSAGITGLLKEAGVAISMDGRGRCMDNIFIERLWRSLKYEAVYLHEVTDGFVAERVIGEWIDS
jgi:putative transposase